MNNAHRPCGTTGRASQVCRLQTGVLPLQLPPSIRQQRRLIPCSDAHTLASYNFHTQLNVCTWPELVLFRGSAGRRYRGAASRTAAHRYITSTFYRCVHGEISQLKVTAGEPWRTWSLLFCCRATGPSAVRVPDTRTPRDGITTCTQMYSFRL